VCAAILAEQIGCRFPLLLFFSRLPVLSAQTTSIEPAPIALSAAIETFNGVSKLSSRCITSTRAIHSFAFVTTLPILTLARSFRSGIVAIEFESIHQRKAVAATDDVFLDG
jgi:hypothetical protein